MNDEEFLSGLELSPTTNTIVYEYRAYYDTTGRVTQYTMQKPAGQYIVITAQQYAESNMNAVVKNGQLIDTRKIRRTCILEQNVESGIKTSKYDVSVLADEHDTEFTYWKLTTYDN